jgi:hypothetical protein
MCARDMFERVLSGRRALDRAEDYAAKMHQLAVYSKGGIDPDRVVTDRFENRSENKFLRAVDAGEKYREVAKRQGELETEAEVMLSMLEYDKTAVCVIRMHYLEAKEWPEVQKISGMSRAGMFKAANRGFDWLDSHVNL